MASKYISPTADLAQNSSDEETEAENWDHQMSGDAKSAESRQPAAHPTVMSATKSHNDKQKDKLKKSRKSTSHDSSTRTSHRDRSKPSSARRSLTVSRDLPHTSSRVHRRVRRRRHTDISESDNSEGEPDYAETLAEARGRLTSPSLISTLTSLTTATNSSGGSSGSNSTITQASVSRRFAAVRSPEPISEIPSPAVPDPPPDVFAYLDQDSPMAMGGGEKSKPDMELEPHWPGGFQDDEEPPLPHDTTSSISSSLHSDDTSERAIDHGNETDRSSSPERSSQGTDTKEARNDTNDDDDDDDDSDEDNEDQDDDNDSDEGNHGKSRPARTSFPSIQYREIKPLSLLETSRRPRNKEPNDQLGNKGSSQSREQEASGSKAAGNAAADASMKYAAKLEAARQRQNIHSKIGTSMMGSIPRSSSPTAANKSLQSLPHIAQQKQQQSQRRQSTPQRSAPPPPRPAPRSTEMPPSGYELLASRLSLSPDYSGAIKPIYRRFEAMNHRILLHLQDELCELEDQLKQLDNIDTHTRSLLAASGGHEQILPGSRRPSSYTNPDFEWHKTDLLGRIAFKLSQYNQALSSFHETEKLDHAELEDVNDYREYLDTERPIVNQETHFLDTIEDLVDLRQTDADDDVSSVDSSLSSLPSSAASSHQSQAQSLASSFSRRSSTKSATMEEVTAYFRVIFAAVLIAILVPILAFALVPGFVARMTVVVLVGGGVLAGVSQSGIVSLGVLGTNGLMMGSAYACLMAVIAGVVV